MLQNNLVVSQAVGMQISILQGTATGTAVYEETQTLTTNTNGLVSLEIGTGTIVSGTFNTIDWSNGPFFIKTETDPTGGTAYTITGTSELLSVPYALHAKTAENFSGTITESQISDLVHTIDTDTQLDSTDIAAFGYVANNDSFYLGQDTLGGIVYYIYKDENGEQHGLIVNHNESVAQWQSSMSEVSAYSTYDGSVNTTLMVNSPAANYATGLGAGWYVPSIDELILLFNNRFTANRGLENGGYTMLNYFNVYYWTSTEGNSSAANIMSFYTAEIIINFKTNLNHVRAVRSF
jgi:hypothetical protein